MKFEMPLTEINNPSDEFVKYFARPIYPGRFNDVVMGQFRAIVKQALTIHQRLHK